MLTEELETRSTWCLSSSSHEHPHHLHREGPINVIAFAERTLGPTQKCAFHFSPGDFQFARRAGFVFSIGRADTDVLLAGQSERVEVAES